MRQQIAVIDFGSQYSLLVVKKLRHAGFNAALFARDTPFDAFKSPDVDALILSGGPLSVYDERDAFSPYLSLGRPVLGICYGLHMLVHECGGHIRRSSVREYGPERVKCSSTHPLFHGLPESFQSWMSHGDSIDGLPENFDVIAKTADHIAAIAHRTQPFVGVQFHPEVSHTEYGSTILTNFLEKVAGLKPNISPDHLLIDAEKVINDAVPDKNKHVVCGVSGGVDSTVLAILLDRVLGNNVECIFVDNGLLRSGEVDEVKKRFTRDLPLKNFRVVDAASDFINALKGVSDSEQKRKIVGRVFADVFFKEAGNFDFLAQGTLYPDVIESAGFGGASASDTIKTHHNRVEEIRKLMAEGRVLEPLATLFKDEVRQIGHLLGLSHDILYRHPFPGPGLAIRVLGEVEIRRIEMLRHADDIWISYLREVGWYDKLDQALCVLLSVETIGVLGDARSKGYVVGLRAVKTQDYMTADVAEIPYDILKVAASRIVNRVEGIIRVVFDLTTKPPATIEWE